MWTLSLMSFSAFLFCLPVRKATRVRWPIFITTEWDRWREMVRHDCETSLFLTCIHKRAKQRTLCPLLGKIALAVWEVGVSSAGMHSECLESKQRIAFCFGEEPSGSFPSAYAQLCKCSLQLDECCHVLSSIVCFGSNMLSGKKKKEKFCSLLKCMVSEEINLSVIPEFWMTLEDPWAGKSQGILEI